MVSWLLHVHKYPVFKRICHRKIQPVSSLHLSGKNVFFPAPRGDCAFCRSKKCLQKISPSLANTRSRCSWYRRAPTPTACRCRCPRAIGRKRFQITDEVKKAMFLGSFSALSKPNFVSKYSLESSRRDLHNALLCTVLQSKKFSQKSSSFFALQTSEQNLTKIG